MNKHKKRQLIIRGIFFLLIVFFLFSGIGVIWAISLPIPDFNNYFADLSKIEPTKIYDRTGKVLLYNMSGSVRRIQVPLSEMSKYIKSGTIAIEDDTFYTHKGIKPTSILRAVLVDIASGSKKQGASTITQQVIKNTLLTNEKTITRKIKEWVLAIKMEQVMSKEEILELYLNQIPYGGNMYGIEEASNTFFKKSAKDLTLIESAYLAAIPQAPTTYSPYGQNRDLLEARKNLVIDRMASLGYISEDEATRAKNDKIIFSPAGFRGVNAPHFVFFIKSYLEEKYGGATQIEKMGLKIITTLDFNLQQKAEEIVKKYATENEKNFNAKNAAMVVIDPKTGEILAMVGSRDYFDIENEGNFNVTLAHRQPGSSFKPFVYATAFNQGYTPDTTLFDLPTEFNPSCIPTTSASKAKECYMPVNYDDKYLGPLSLRNALAQSRNIPAVKLLYLTGINNALTTAKKMGITSLKNKDTYGLTLVLGGGEVSLLEMTSAYGVFANDGVRLPYTGILKIEDINGDILEEYNQIGEKVLPENTAREISSILSDNVARTPAYGVTSPLYIPGRDMAAKTGTTNDFRDTWIIGYTPNLAVGAWAGNNDNSSISKKVAGMVVAPMWGAFMREALTELPNEKFIPPNPISSEIKPVLRGVWQGQVIGQTDNTEQISTNIHSILHWVDKNNPQGATPINPNSDGQYKNWEYPIQIWANKNGYIKSSSIISLPISTQTGQTGSSPIVTIVNPQPNTSYNPTDNVLVQLNVKSGASPIKKTEFYINENLIKTTLGNQTKLEFSLLEIKDISEDNELLVVVYDQKGNKAETSTNFTVNIASSTPVN